MSKLLGTLHDRSLRHPDVVVGAALAIQRTTVAGFLPDVSHPTLDSRAEVRLVHAEPDLLRRLHPRWRALYREKVVRRPVTAQRMGPQRRPRAPVQEGVRAALANVRKECQNKCQNNFADTTVRRAHSSTVAVSQRFVPHRTRYLKSIKQKLDAFRWTGRRFEHLFGGWSPRPIDWVVGLENHRVVEMTSKIYQKPPSMRRANSYVGGQHRA